MPPRDPDDRGRKILIGALAASLLLHALLALISLFVPFARAVVAATRPDENEIRFRFQEPDESSRTVDGERRGEVLADRIPTPSPQDTMPIPLPAPDIDPRPHDTRDQPLPRLPEPRPDTRATSEPGPQAGVEGLRDAPDPAEDRPGLDLPPSERGEMAPGQSAPRQGVDLERALRSFQDAVERSSAAQPRPRSERNVFVPDPGDLPTQGAPYGLLEFSSRDYDWSDYARQLYERIMVAWYRRLDQSTSEFERWGRANRKLELVDRVQVQFTIERNGDVTGVLVQNASSCPPLDLSATDALEEVLLPALPEDFPRDREIVHGTFVVTAADVFAMDDWFGYLKRYGIWPMNRGVSRDRATPIDGTEPRR